MTENGQKYHPLHADRQNIDDSQPPADGPAGVWGTLGMLASRLKAITGRSTWRDEPPTNLTEAHAHQQNTENPHGVTRAQLGAAAQTALDSHTAARDNPHGVTAAQAGARPATWVPGWNEVTGKPQGFDPTNHKERHYANGLDPLRAVDVGAVPLSRKINTGPGLNGGRDLNADPTLGLRVYGFAAADMTGAADINLSYATDTVLPLPGELQDSDGRFASGVYTVGVAGRYVLYAFIRYYSLAATDTAFVFVTKNNSRLQGAEVAGFRPGTGVSTIGGSAPMTLAAGDQLRLVGRVDGSNGTPQIRGNAFTSLSVGYWGSP